MHDISVVRRTALCALAALTLFAGTLFVAAPRASAALGDCPANSMCAWVANDYDGAFSAWSASDTGCHDHTDKPDLRSFYNNTSNKTLQLVGWGVTFSPGWGGTNAGDYAGALCW
jgi:hypothetical protein